MHYNNYTRFKESTVEDYNKKRISAMNSLKMQLEWVKRQLEYITFQEEFEPIMDLKKGEIYEFDFGVNVNCEFSHRHYGLVLADSHPGNPLVTVVPLKTNRFGANKNSDVNLGILDELVSAKETLAVINQIRTLDKMRMYVRPIINRNDNNALRLLSLDKTKMDEVDKAICEYYKLK